MIAALPMYDMPGQQPANDAFWAAVRDALRARGIAAPDALDREIGLMEGWQAPELVLGQTCGLPFRTRLHDRVTLLATADYGLEDTPPGHYRSLFVVRAGEAAEDPEDYATRRFAYNQPDSHSGWAAPQIWAGKRGFRFPGTLETGAHRDSAHAVAGDRADIAAIDAITWAMLNRHEPDLTGALKVIGRTDSAPGQALIAGPGSDAEAGFAALCEALEALAPDMREALMIRQIVRIPAAEYLAVPTPPGP
ncbi:phosphate/phosphite/phosphonate ABC transporter substrate-binding protein [Solirhodobacter olei]|uniref:phosphate/phosphite/phosphonate ABC transporter substrate-binding protein n=1 Tax=Solirhodobacter olei TaxID=2493082 RepID=UPI000FDC8141|nr:PhnD/SsuA/transferrin family substrate-binding protein [Solirhodobacter olei]